MTNDRESKEREFNWFVNSIFSNVLTNEKNKNKIKTNNDINCSAVGILKYSVKIKKKITSTQTPCKRQTVIFFLYYEFRLKYCKFRTVKKNVSAPRTRTVNVSIAILGFRRSPRGTRVRFVESAGGGFLYDKTRYVPKLNRKKKR